MCGICGKHFFKEPFRVISRDTLHAMMRAIEHRGPDAEGTYFSNSIGLGHKRLSIIDLESGAQPMTNEDHSIWVIFNGEIYNYQELRSFLLGKGHVLRTSSDTEVIVHLYEEFGEAFVTRLNGMFSFALWDEKTASLLLARDRVGIKPLYYCLTNNSILFASEIKSLLADPTVSREIDLEAVDRFLRIGYLPGDKTLFKNVRKLLPGHLLTVRRGSVKISQYWDLRFSQARANQAFEANVEELDGLLQQVVRDHMMSDVPVGVLLSGGVDSTAVLSYATQHASTRPTTFTIGFGEHSQLDERLSARVAASNFGTTHFEATVSAGDFAACLPKYVWHMEEPVCEPPAIALYYVTQLARENVTVLLSGEGGDEAFAGYQNYRNLVWLERLKSAVGPLARPIARAVANIAQAGDSEQLIKYAGCVSLPIERYYYSRAASPFDFFSRNRETFYSSQLLSEIHGTEQAFLNGLLRGLPQSSPLDKFLYIDTKTWLPDDLLVKADKITMAHSVELRVPFLDHRVLEFAASLPPSHKLNGFKTKHVLKRTLANRVPKETLTRPKTGFPVPYDKWLRGELKTLVWDVLTDDSTRQRGYFHQHEIENLLRRNTVDGRYSKEVFSLVVLELWHRAFLDRDIAASAGLLQDSTHAMSLIH